MDQNQTPWVACRWKKETRYYVAEVLQDLFGTWLLRRSWGSLVTQRGHSQTIPTADYSHALKLLDETVKRRRRRGYLPTL